MNETQKELISYDREGLLHLSDSLSPYVQKLITTVCAKRVGEIIITHRSLDNGPASIVAGRTYCTADEPSCPKGCAIDKMRRFRSVNPPSLSFPRWTRMQEFNQFPTIRTNREFLEATVTRKIRAELDMNDEADFLVLLAVAERLSPGIYITLQGNPAALQEEITKLFESF